MRCSMMKGMPASCNIDIVVRSYLLVQYLSAATSTT